MQVIKFRGKIIDDPSGHWLFGDLRHTSDSVEIISLATTGDAAKVSPETVGQYVGLKDRKDTEIYEGDIVQSDKYTYVVVYNAHYASFGLCREQDAFLHYFGEALYADECEVIGNVYDNPDLAKKVLGEKAI